MQSNPAYAGAMSSVAHTVQEKPKPVVKPVDKGPLFTEIGSVIRLPER